MDARRVATGVWRLTSGYVNCYLIDAGSDGVTLVDCGLPDYDRELEDAVAATGRRLTDVRALLLTHGHIDHVGTAGRIAAAGVTAYLHPDDVALARDPKTNRTERSLVPYLTWPATLAFVVHCARNGALRPPPAPTFEALDDGARLDVPGSPRVLHLPGHTAGSCVFEFTEHGVTAIGDTLCTAEPFLGRRVAPQLQSRGSSRDCDQALRSLDRLADVSTEVLLPGHGSPWHGGVPSAIASARSVGCR